MKLIIKVLCFLALFFVLALPVKAVTVRTNRVGKILGSSHEWDKSAGIKVQNNDFKNVAGTDLGPITWYNNKFWFSLGDTQFQPGVWGEIKGRSFLVPYSSDTSLWNGIEMDDYLNSNGRPYTAISSSPWYPIPNDMFTIKWQGKEYMFGQFMSVQEVSGHDHHIDYAGIVKYNPGTGMFEVYKQNTYKWPGEWRHFGMSSFWVNYDLGYLYMLGSPSGRFGGIKLGRIKLSKFMNPGDRTHWEYYLGDGQWTGPTSDFNQIKKAEWLIEPKDSDWSVGKNYDDLPWSEQCSLITLAEFSLVYNPYLNKFILITGRPCHNANGGVWYYTAPHITGPWSKEKLLMANDSAGGNNWSFYGTYTDGGFLRQGGRLMYFVATTWEPYGVYLYQAEFFRSVDFSKAETYTLSNGFSSQQGNNNWYYYFRDNNGTIKPAQYGTAQMKPKDWYGQDDNLYWHAGSDKWLMIDQNYTVAGDNQDILVYWQAPEKGVAQISATKTSNDDRGNGFKFGVGRSGEVGSWIWDLATKQMNTGTKTITRRERIRWAGDTLGYFEDSLGRTYGDTAKHSIEVKFYPFCLECSDSGDANCDQRIDLKDYASWLKVIKDIDFGKEVSLDEETEVDFNCSKNNAYHVVDLNDLQVWLNNFNSSLN